MLFVSIIHSINEVHFHLDKPICDLCESNMPGFYEKAAVPSLSMCVNIQHRQTTYTAWILPVSYRVKYLNNTVLLHFEMLLDWFNGLY